MIDQKLYVPPDVLQANAEWGCNCGPASVAALLGMTCSDVRRYFPDWKGYTQVTIAKKALAMAGYAHRSLYPPAFPNRGLAILQIDGPWCNPGVPVRVAYKHMHVVAVSGDMVYDINAGEWITHKEWRRDIMPEIEAAHKGATGWHVRHGIEVGW